MMKKPTYEELEQWVKEWEKEFLEPKHYKKTLNIYDWLYILYEGRVVEEGDSEKTYQSRKAPKAYLGYKSLISIEGVTAHLRKLMKEL